MPQEAARDAFRGFAQTVRIRLPVLLSEKHAYCLFGGQSSARLI
jgi:hypothetical protein